MPSTPTPTLHARAWLSSLGTVLVAGLLLREAFSFWTGHPFDFEIWMRTGHAVAQGQNPYAMWPPVPGASFTYPGQTLPAAAYLPLWPVLLGGIYRAWEVIGFGNRFVLYFLLKQPGILSDVASAFLLHRLVLRWTGNARQALTAATFWSFFPYAIVITAIWGMFDSIVVVLLLATFLTADPVRRNLLWGVGILVKWVTAVFLPLEFFRERGIRRLAFVLGLVVPVGATALLFLGARWSLVGITNGSLSQSLGGGYGMNYADLLSNQPLVGVLSPIPYLYQALGYLWIPGALLSGWLGARWLTKATPESEVRAAMLVVSTFLLLRWGLNEQYMLYIFVLMAADIVAFHPERRNLFLALFGLSLADLLANNDLGIRFISPIDPGIWPYAEGLDASAVYGTIRTDVLMGIALVITLTLIQLIYTTIRDDGQPRPWLIAFLPRRPPKASTAPETTPG